MEFFSNQTVIQYENINVFSGVCTCNPGFSGDDCGIDESALPVLTGLDNSGLCDLTAGSCLQFSIYGENFLNGSITCHFSASEVSSL